MHKQIETRGPDSSGFYLSDYVAFAHRRLSIIDLSESADQPFIYDDRYVLVYNGEIYNYLELRAELVALGYKFKTFSDTEVLLIAYVHWGNTCISRFNGMWSFVVYDKLTSSIFASRDRFGIKPLYYHIDKHFLYIASEPKQIRALDLCGNASLDELSLFLFAGIAGSSSNTFFEGLYTLPAGHSLFASTEGDFRIFEWYRPSFQGDTSSVSFTSLFKDSISLRMRSDVNVGSCLSGGLDSSSVVLTASDFYRNHSDSQFTSIHARSTDLETDESSFADFVAAAANSSLSYVVPSPSDFWDNIFKIARVQDEPFGSPSICMQYFVMQRARSLNCPVMLDGQGADEILLGYSKFLSLSLTDSWNTKGPLSILPLLLSSWSANSSLTPISTLKYLIATLFSPLRSMRVYRRMSFLDLPLLPTKRLYQQISHNSSNCFQTQLLELYKTSLPALLRYEDRNSMAHSIEARLPFLDYRLVEYALALPVDAKIFKGWTKYPLRTSGLLPDHIAWRKSKLGFNAPERTWISRYQDQMLSYVLDSPLISAISNRRSLEKRWPKLDRREKWRLFSVSIWSDIFNIRA